MSLFFLKKLLSAFIMPLSLVLFLLVAAIFLFHKKPKWSKYCLVLATSALFLMAWPPLSDALIEPLEQKYPPYTQAVQSVDYIVVLGSGHTENPELPVTAQLYPFGLERVVEAYRIYLLHPQANIITSGYAVTGHDSNAEKIKQALILLGVPKNKITAITGAKDTAEEATLISPLVINTKVVLITNANHMPRSMTYFIEQGINPIAAPTGYKVRQFTLRGRDYDKTNKWDYYLPHARKIEQTTTVWYEWLGLTVQWLKALFD